MSQLILKEKVIHEVEKEIHRMFLEKGYDPSINVIRRVTCYSDKDGYFGGCKVNVPEEMGKCVRMIMFEKMVESVKIPIVVLVPLDKKLCEHRKMKARF